jgi:ribosomal-protein-alanine N-acetyltransferase
MPDLVRPALSGDAFFAGEQPALSGQGLTLRPWRPGDVPALVRAYSDPALQQWHMRSMTAREAPAWIEDRSRRWRERAGVDWAVCDEAGPVLGRIAFHRFVLQEGLGEIAYWVLPEARGRRLAPRALEVVCSWAFGRGLHRIELGHAVANQPSCRVAERAGFTLEGVRRQELLHADGWHDTHLHARLASDPAPASYD